MPGPRPAAAADMRAPEGRADRSPTPGLPPCGLLRLRPCRAPDRPGRSLRGFGRAVVRLRSLRQGYARARRRPPIVTMVAATSPSMTRQAEGRASRPLSSRAP